jgi:hypothetical protein
MLSPHEFAALMVIKYGSEDVAPDCAEIDALRRLQLVTLKCDTSGAKRLLVTDNGHRILRAAAQT